MDKYKAGDKVVIKSERPLKFNSYGAMDQWLGKTMTIVGFKHAHTTAGERGYQMLEDKGLWYWDDDMIDHEATKVFADIKVQDLEEGKLYREKSMDKDLRFKIENDYLWVKYDKDKSWWECEESLGVLLRCSFIEVEAEDFPSPGDDYYCIELIKGSVGKTFWADDEVDKQRLSLNNVFKTEEEAEQKLTKIKEILKPKKETIKEEFIEDFVEDLFGSLLHDLQKL
jgi:hypothetical protein